MLHTQVLPVASLLRDDRLNKPVECVWGQLARIQCDRYAWL